MDILLSTGIISFIIQVLTGFFDIYVLTFHHDEKYHLVRELLKVELYVQIIEGIFYLWLILNFQNIKNITPHRYYDWVITTPTMLFTYCVYLLHLKKLEETNNKYNSEQSEQLKKENKESFYEIIQNNTPTLVPIFILNTLMLGFGYLEEMGKIDKLLGISLGFIPFFWMFWIIYDNYAKFTSIGIMTFYYFVFVWGLYGVAAFMSYRVKNIAYNILDLFSKNFFGIFLAAILFMNRKT
jgi:hypothetical protein